MDIVRYAEDASRKVQLKSRDEDLSLHDDWISAVDGSSRFILTGCYDGLGRIWKAAGVCTHVLEGHCDQVTAVGVVKTAEEENTDLVVATGAKDYTVKLWKLYAEPHAETQKIGAYRTLRGHTASVRSVAAGPTANMLCSGSWDSTIKLWQTSKKRKRGNEEEETQSEGEAVSTLVGHTQCVSSLVWPEHGTIYSASFDCSIRRWDVETRKNTLDMFSGKSIKCIDVGHGGESSTLIAGVGGDSILTIWDLRQPGTLAPSFRLSSHTSWINACKWHKSSCFHLLSASHDKKVMLWDIRTTSPFHIIDSHEDLVLCADWWNGDRVVSGGADFKLRISSEICIP